MDRKVISISKERMSKKLEIAAVKTRFSFTVINVGLESS